MAQLSQYSDPVEYVEKNLAKPAIREHTQRKRLVFVQRSFAREMEKRIIIGYQAIIDAGQLYQQGQRQRWLPWMTSYDRRERLDNLCQVFKNSMGSDPKFRMFSVILSSVLFISKEQGTGMSAIMKYFKSAHHIQPGAHVFVRPNGNLSSITMNFVIKQVGKTKYFGHNLPPIQGIYPAIRHEWQSTGNDSVAYGLYFSDLSEGQTDDEISGRYYHRYSDYCLKAYGVNELTKEDILKFKQRIGDKPFTAIYLCAGAKLVVTDPYSREVICGNDSEHNRSLIQQGGVLIYEGVINIKFHVKSFKQEGPTFEINDWPNLFAKHIKQMSENGPDYETLDQVVVFLGGIDSERNSIAWDFSVEDRNGSTVGCLGIPIQGNRNTLIEAVSKGSAGLDEIIARMGYEQLHDSVLTEHRTDFIPVQNYEMLRNILNINGERSLDVDYRIHLNPTHTDILTERTIPQEFNLSYPSSSFLEQENNEFFQNQLMRKTRAAPPPMYPPIKSSSNIQYWPSSELPIADEIQCYLYDRHNTLNIKFKLGNSTDTYEYSKVHEVKGYHFERMTREGDQDYRNHSGIYHCSGGSTYRIGVDGWMWRKVCRTDGLSSRIYYEGNIYLERKKTPKNESPKRTHPTQGGSHSKRSKR